MKLIRSPFLQIVCFEYYVRSKLVDKNWREKIQAQRSAEAKKKNVYALVFPVAVLVTIMPRCGEWFRQYRLRLATRRHFLTSFSRAKNRGNLSRERVDIVWVGRKSSAETWRDFFTQQQEIRRFMLYWPRRSTCFGVLCNNWKKSTSEINYFSLWYKLQTIIMRLPANAHVQSQQGCKRNFTSIRLHKSLLTALNFDFFSSS